MCQVGEIKMLVWWRYKVEEKAKELSGRDRIKLCVVHGSVWHNACMVGLQPFLPM